LPKNTEINSEYKELAHNTFKQKVALLGTKLESIWTILECYSRLDEQMKNWKRGKEEKSKGSKGPFKKYVLK